LNPVRFHLQKGLFVYATLSLTVFVWWACRIPSANDPVFNKVKRFVYTFDKTYNTETFKLYPHTQTQQQHFKGEEHNPNYDHEAFLGQKADEFDNVTPEKS